MIKLCNAQMEASTSFPDIVGRDRESEILGF
jgi:hypothetical protein